MFNWFKKEEFKKPVSITNILVIDDEIDLIKMLKENTKHPPHTNVFYCTDTQDAIFTLRKNKIHAVLSDVNVPQKQELEMELDKHYGNIPVFRMTGEVGRCVNLILKKPFKIKDFELVINEINDLANLCKVG